MEYHTENSLQCKHSQLASHYAEHRFESLILTRQRKIAPNFVRHLVKILPTEKACLFFLSFFFLTYPEKRQVFLYYFK